MTDYGSLIAVPVDKWCDTLDELAAARSRIGALEAALSDCCAAVEGDYGTASEGLVSVCRECGCALTDHVASCEFARARALLSKEPTDAE